VSTRKEPRKLGFIGVFKNRGQGKYAADTWHVYRNEGRGYFALNVVDGSIEENLTWLEVCRLGQWVGESLDV